MSRNTTININKPHIIVYTEDSKSSNFYLTELSKQVARNRLIIEAINKRCGGNPKTLIEEAIKDIKIKKRMRITNNTYCILFDLDTKVAIDNYTEVKNIAKEHNIQVYVLEPNFEYYHINHFKKYYSNDYKKELEKHYNMDMDDIKKNYGIYRNLVADKKLLENAINNCKQNTTNRTNFYNFVKLILESK